MTDSTQKCRAKGGPAGCTDPRCPERQQYLAEIVPAEYKALAKLRKPATPSAWTEKDTVLFKTIHGSRLYGLEHADSDDDFYIVTPTVRAKKLSLKNAKHKIDGNLDTLSVDFASFVMFAQKGTPQALETMFSKKAESPFFEEFRQSWFASDPAVITKYIQTIHNFSMDEGPKQEKYKRHGLRLSMNLDELVHTGRFNPTLNPHQVETVRRLSKLPGKRYLTELNAINPFDLYWTHE
jgi:hypothetical protein